MKQKTYIKEIEDRLAKLDHAEAEWQKGANEEKELGEPTLDNSPHPFLANALECDKALAAAWAAVMSNARNDIQFLLDTIDEMLETSLWEDHTPSCETSYEDQDGTESFR